MLVPAYGYEYLVNFSWFLSLQICHFNILLSTVISDFRAKMEVDEVEADLLRQFNCLNTSDKDVLVRELQGILGKDAEISEESARFYLDMADW